MGNSVLFSRNMNKTYLMVLLGIASLNSAHADFFSDSKTSIYLRNFYVDRDYYEGGKSNIGSWSQAVSTKFESGYTDTPIQVGLDLTAQYALRLNNMYDTRDDMVLPYNKSTGKQERDYSKFGATLKLKYSKTELKVGELYPTTPVIFIDDSRQLPTTYMGAMLESKEIKDLKITLGRITRINARNDDEYEKMTLFKPGVIDPKDSTKQSDGMNLVGLDYNFTPSISGAYWFGQLEDIYHQHYLNLVYSTAIKNTKVKLDGRYFNSSDDGSAIDGKVDSQSFGLMTTLKNGMHTLAFGVRKNYGTTNFPTIGNYPPQPYLHAWSNLGFIAPDELMWHVAYTYDFTDAGVPGLSTTFRYLHGTGMSRTKLTGIEGLPDNKEYEKIATVAYMVPKGKFKGLGLQASYIVADQKYQSSNNNVGNKFKETRLIVSYKYTF